MKDNRRDFLKLIGLGSGTLLINPITALADVHGITAKELKAKNDVFAVRKMTTDVLIVGGGLSGVCAALAAARNGSKVVFIQNRSRLGGNASSEIRMHICGATQLKQVWRETGILEELMLAEAVANPQKSYEMFDFVLYDKIINEKNIALLLDTMLFEVQTKGNKIAIAKGYCSQTEELYEISAKYYADCTGDGTMAALAGAECMTGREAKSKWNESLGQDKEDMITMGNSLLFMAEEHDKPMPYTAPVWARKFTFEDFKYRKIKSWEFGYWWLELGGTSDIIKDGQMLRHELLSVLYGVWDYIKNSGNHPKSENWALSWVGTIPGKRESRRVVGDYIMTQKDIQAAKLMEDRVAYGGWPLDDHLPAGMDDTSLSPFRSIPLKGPYSIPMRSLYSKNISNLFMAGRNISVSHVALSTTRVMATCATMGQAVGTAASYCIQKNVSPAAMCTRVELINEMQQLLLRQDQALLGVVNTDEKDLARKAIVKASSETQDGKAMNVIDGINRDINDGTTHQWRADMKSGEVWIELQWQQAIELSTVEFTFDTGLHRFLRISGEKTTHARQIRGAQPETIADYKLEVSLGNNIVNELEIKNNYMRKVSHVFTSVKADKIRLAVQKNHGDPFARLFEIRCYS